MSPDKDKDWLKSNLQVGKTDSDIHKSEAY